MILVYGTICIDRVFVLRDLPKPGGYAEIVSQTSVLGGEAANTAAFLHAWGREIQLAGNPMGDGADGELLAALVREKGLPDAHIRLGNGPVPVCYILVTADGERTMFGQGFGDFGRDNLLEGVPFEAGNWFTADPNMSRASREAARRAIDAGMSIYLMDFIQPDDPIVPGSYWQCSTDWVGRRGDVQHNVEYVKELVERRQCHAILSDGPNGLVAGSPSHAVRHFPPFPCPHVVDSTGAGDAFRAGMLYGLDQGWDFGSCLRFASAAGCLKCQSLGATSRIPTVAEIEDHIAANPEVADRYRLG